MSDTVICVENLFKEYRLGVISHGTLYRDFQSWVARVRHKEDPNSRVDIVNNNDSIHSNDRFMALRDVFFEVKQGDVLGIIGRNGAGKSTLLKVLSRVTAPTKGIVRIKGRIASLLEVGTGFHPELTGRENIYLNGSILGMTKKEISKKFDEIVAFAEVEKFIDTPVKRYSSGMYVRLAFAVAAHLEPEILVVDEVLAVGDIQFQKKCLGKMGEIGKEGRTVLFVSHNMGAISSLCTKGIILQNGSIVFGGDIQEAVRLYTSDPLLSEKTEWKGQAGDENIKLLHTWVQSLFPDKILCTSSDIEIGVQIEVLKPINGLILGFTLYSEYGYELAYVLYDDDEFSAPEEIEPGVMIKKFKIPSNTLAYGTYKIEFDIGIHSVKRIINSEGSLLFTLENTNGIGRRFNTQHVRGRAGIFRPQEFLI